VEKLGHYAVFGPDKLERAKRADIMRSGTCILCARAQPIRGDTRNYHIVPGSECDDIGPDFINNSDGLMAEDQILMGT
jgi:hypothetical protein